MTRFEWRVIEQWPNPTGERRILARGAGDRSPWAYDLQPDGSIRIEYLDGSWLRIDPPAELCSWALEVKRVGIDPEWQNVPASDESEYV